jgi:DnaJ-class molecular chaperone
VSSYTADQVINPEKYGLVICLHCNGYGSSLKESSDRCTKCEGSGVMTAAEAKAYNDLSETSQRKS